MAQIKVEFDAGDYKKLQSRLGSMKSEAPRVLKIAINETARQTKTLLAKRARETYTIKSAKFKNAIKPTFATTSTLGAVLNVSGATQPLSYFETKNNTKKTAAKARGRKDKPLKEIISITTGNKSFTTSFSKGGKNLDVTNKKAHKAIMQREGKERLPIKQFYGPSDPQMIGSKKVYGEIESQIEEKLKKNVERQVNRILGGY